MKKSSTGTKALFVAFVSLAALTAAHGAQAPDSADKPASDKAADDGAKQQEELTTLRGKAQQLNQQIQNATPKPMNSKGRDVGGKADAGMKRDPSRGAAKGAMGNMGAMGDMNDAPMRDMSDMGMMDAGMSGPQSAASSGMGMMDHMGGKGMMGMGGPGAMQSSLPGFPGQSRLYHIGATGFFLDHPEHIALTAEQAQALTLRKEQAQLQQDMLAQKIERAEEELWQLTASDQPQAGAIEKKARSIEKMRADQRIAFIRAVGDAAKVLTDHQRHQLTGMLPPEPKMSDEPAPNQTSDGAMPPMEPMGPMEPMKPMEPMEPMEHLPEM